MATIQVRMEIQSMVNLCESRRSLASSRVRHGSSASSLHYFHNFDSLLVDIGGFGRYQMVQYLLLGLVQFLAGCLVFEILFLAASPQFQCIPLNRTIDGDNYTITNRYLGLTNTTLITPDTLTTKPIKGRQEQKLADDENRKETCELYESREDHNLCIGMNFSQKYYRKTIVTEWTLVCSQKTYVTFVKSLFFAGRLVGAGISGLMSDRFGRKLTLLVFLGLVIVSGCIVGFAPNIVVFIVGYFIRGAAQGGIYSVSAVLTTESLVPDKRKYGGVMYSCFYILGMYTLTGLAWVCPHWRYISGILTGPAVLMMSYAYFVDESTRWLLSQNRIDCTIAQIRRICKINKVNLSSDFYETLKLEKLMDSHHSNNKHNHKEEQKIADEHDEPFLRHDPNDPNSQTDLHSIPNRLSLQNDSQIVQNYLTVPTDFHSMQHGLSTQTENTLKNGLSTQNEYASKNGLSTQNEHALQNGHTEEPKSNDEEPNPDKLIINFFKIIFTSFFMSRVCITVWVSTFTSSLTWYGMAFNQENLLGNPYFNFLLFAVSQTATFTACFVLVDRIGRKPLSMGTFIIGGIICCVYPYIPIEPYWVQTIVSLVGQFVVGAAYTVITFYAMEIMPTSIRNLGYSVNTMVARIAGGISPLLIDLRSLYVPLPHLIFGILSLICGISFVMVPETAGRPLPESVKELKSRLKIRTKSKPTEKV